MKDIPSQTGKIALVTGANSGIGWHTALELARAGARVLLGVRSTEKGADATNRILAQVPTADLKPYVIDLASLASIHEFVKEIETESRLDLLINNAGVMSVPSRQLTPDGFEIQFGTNFLGPFALTALLFPMLLKSPAPRVTTVSSAAATLGWKKIDFENLQGERSYDPWKSYCQSKLADLIFAVELARRCEQAKLNVVSNAAHPGYVLTNLQSTGKGHSPTFLEKLFARVVGQNAASGALPTLKAATIETGSSGEYFGPKGIFQIRGAPVQIPVPTLALDPSVATRLWDAAERLTQTQFQVI